MKPFDLRLLRASRAVGQMLAIGVLWALLQSLGIVLFAWFATAIVVGFGARAESLDWPGLIGGVLLGVALRALAQWGGAASAAWAAARAKAELRRAGMAAIRRGGPELLLGGSRAEHTLLFGRGLDALDDYFGSYLPQLLLAVVSTPLLLLVIWLSDPASAITLVLVLPLVPLFMVLIGLATRSVQQAQWAALGALGRQFLDLLDGLATLKIFRRERAQSAGIRASGQEYRRRSMRVLRLSFLSGFVLELAATLSVALVAVLIGTRLVEGTLGLSVGLFVLLLVPDVFAPIRQVGSSFHAAADGLTAAESLFTLIERAAALAPELALAPSAESARQPVGAAAAGEPPRPGIELAGFTVWRGEHPVVHGFDAEFEPGRLHVIVGESGAGKSSLLAGILGFARSSGSLSCDGVPGPALERVAWAPQRPSLLAGTIASNIGANPADPIEAAALERALALAAASDLDPLLELGAGGAGLSGGQAQRVNLARAFYRLETRAEVRTLLLDEPSSALDGDTQARLLGQLRGLADAGVTIIAVSHRDGLLRAADRVWTVAAAS